MKFLIVKTSSLGDIIHCFPVLHYLHRRFVDAQVDWVVEKPYCELLRAHSGLHRIHTLDSKTWRRHAWRRSTWREAMFCCQSLRAETYDVVFDLQGNIKSGLLMLMLRGRDKIGFGRKSVPEWPNVLFTKRRFDPPCGVNVREDYMFIVQQAFGDQKDVYVDQRVSLTLTPEQQEILEKVLQGSVGQRYAVVCPGSRWLNKQLPIEVLADFLCLLQRHLGFQYFCVWGTPEEKEVAIRLCRDYDLSGTIVDRLQLPVLQNLMASVDLVIAMDSLPLHLAGTTSTPTFSVFGASSMTKYKPLGIAHCGMQGVCPHGRVFEKRCPIVRTCSSGACMRNFTSEGLFQSFLSWNNRLQQETEGSHESFRSITARGR